MILNRKAQTAIEYLLLLAVVMAIVLVGLKKYTFRVYRASELYFNKAGNTMMGKKSLCGDTICDAHETPEICCLDCGTPACP